MRVVGGFWSNLDTKLSEAAHVVGGNRARVFAEITLPLLLPSIAAAGLLIFIFCFTSFGVILILGGPRFAPWKWKSIARRLGFCYRRLRRSAWRRSPSRL